MAEITDAELDEYRQLKAIQAAREKGGTQGPVPLVLSRSLLADGSTHDYLGAHPTHVDTEGGAGPVPVLGAYNL